MADPFIGEVRIFTFDYPPSGWAFCSGQLMAISQNSTLFSIIGTLYGGDGRVTYQLPNLKGRAAMHWGMAPGLSNHILGGHGGEATVTLTESSIPTHSHTAYTERDFADTGSPTNAAPGVLLHNQTGGSRVFVEETEALELRTQSNFLATAGQSLSHENRQPYLVFNFCIALTGYYPSRS